MTRTIPTTRTPVSRSPVTGVGSSSQYQPLGLLLAITHEVVVANGGSRTPVTRTTP